ncbi:hypothetical protein [Natrarchaeobaculum aegyptiacum]|uniref:DUF7847 domain-containing protein n=1 Tax=Natrarchaeobaculum aegyptiacum TaxID=745377 RepID=A0A2Z2HRE2_9EURY|nr:hypothetical protein [Natrarchaeobaculum aegyptiacum]ARS89612.1 hypothetical protein B1756_07590 [Natrarchaeobaculum aegyptiacum]
MAVLPAFKDGLTILRTNPVILLAGLLFALASQLATAGELVGSLVVVGVGFVVALLLGPFFLGGLIGMALEALEGSTTSLGQLVESGRASYVSLLGASLLFGALLFTVTVVGMFVAMFGAVFGFAVGGAESGTVAMLAVGLGILLVLAVMAVAFVLFMFLQFFNTAIVVDGNRAFESFSRSISLVRSNLRSVVGYSLLWIGISLVAFAPVMGLEFVFIDPELAAAGEQTATRAAITGLAVVLTGILYSYLYAVHTSYYTRLGSRTDAPDAESVGA